MPRRALFPGDRFSGKIAANQANAARSTGPVTEAGKNVVSGNSVVHGLAGSSKHAVLPGERAEFENYLAEYLAHFKPANREERSLVLNLAENNWRLRRAHAMEAALFAAAVAETENGVDPITAQAQAWNDKTKGLQRIALYAHRIKRSIDKDSARLDALQSARKAAYAKAQEEAILLSKLARSRGQTFDPAAHFQPDADFGGFAHSESEIAQIVTRPTCWKKPAPASLPNHPPPISPCVNGRP